VPAIPSWVLEPLWVQFAALLPQRPAYDPAHPLGCHRPRISDRIIFGKLVQVLVSGCSYAKIADATCSATTIRDRRDEWIALGAFAGLKARVLEAFDRMIGLQLADVSVDGCITKSPGGGQCAGPSPVDRRKQGMKRSALADDNGVPPGRVLAGASSHDSPLLAPALELLTGLGPLPEDITVHLDAGYDSAVTLATLAGRGLHGEIAHKGEPAPIQAGRRWPIERTHAWHNAFNRLQRCYERRKAVITAFFDLADAIITLRKLIRLAWTTYRWDTRPRRRP